MVPWLEVKGCQQETCSSGGVSLHLLHIYLLNTMDASKSIEDLHREIKTVAEKTMQEVKDEPLGELWK